MSMALTHFAFGAACATLLLSYLPVRTRYAHTVAIASGGWAMVPDFFRVVPVYESVFRRIGESVVGNVFWFHQLFDLVDPGDSHRLAAAMLAGYAMVALVAAEREGELPVFEVRWPEWER